jgi:hypothetical protein
MRKKITLTTGEHQKLLELSRATDNAPNLVFAPDGTHSPHTAMLLLLSYRKELARKYRFVEETAYIPRDSPTFEAETGTE